MVFEEYRRYRTAAYHLATSGAFLKAGHAFTSAAHESLGAADYAGSSLTHSQVDTARAFSSLHSATLSYRLAGVDERSRIRASQGIALAEEIRDHIANYDPQIGCMWEYIGDFHVITGAGEWGHAYESAASHYRECENVIGWIAEPEFAINTSLFLELASAAAHEIDRDTKGEIRSSSLIRRIEYKRANFSDIIESVISRNEWP